MRLQRCLLVSYKTIANLIVLSGVIHLRVIKRERMDRYSNYCCARCNTIQTRIRACRVVILYFSQVYVSSYLQYTVLCHILCVLHSIVQSLSLLMRQLTESFFSCSNYFFRSRLGIDFISPVTIDYVPF